MAQGAELISLSREASTGGAVVPQLQGYLVHGRLGAGTFGEAWAGVQVSTGQRVAVKVFSRKGLDWTLFRQEIQRLIEVAEHPNVVTLLDANLDHDPPFFVMPLLAGSLAESAATPEKVATWLDQVCQGLSYIHARDILHGDLKPGNILLDGEGRARLADFGQSFATNAGGFTLGTLGYMPPEQIQRALGHGSFQPDVRWDIYALGATAYRLLTGKVPRLEDRALLTMSSTSTQYRLRLALQVSQSSLVPVRRLNPKVDHELAAIVEGCLELLPVFRYADAQAIQDDLRCRLEKQPLRIRHPWSAAYQLERAVRRNPALSATLASFVVIMLGGLWLSWAEVSKERKNVADNATQLAQAKVEMERKLAEVGQERQAFARLETSLGIRARDRGEMVEAVLLWAQALTYWPESVELPELMASYQCSLVEMLDRDDLTHLALSDEVLLGACPGGLVLDRRPLLEHPPALAQIEFLGKRILTANSTGQIQLWSPAGKSLLQAWQKDPVTMNSWLSGPQQAACLAVAPNQRHWLAVGPDGACQLFEGDRRKRQFKLAVNPALVRLSSSCIGVLGSNRGLQLLDYQGRPLGAPLAEVDTFELSPSGRSLVWLRGGQAYHSQVDSGRLLADLGPAGRVAMAGEQPRTDQEFPGCVAFSPDGSRLAVVRQRRQLRILETSTGRALSGWLPHPRPIKQVLFSRTAKTVASYDGGQVRVYYPTKLWLDAGASPRETAQRWTGMALDEDSKLRFLSQLEWDALP